MMNEILRIKNLEKNYKKITAVNKLSFDVKEGEILCILGPNGAGKSTAINVLTGALDYEGGEIYYRGRRVLKKDKDFKQRLGIIPQNLAIYEDITALQNVKFFASLYGIKGKALHDGAMAALDIVGMKDKAMFKVKTFSGGMKRRLNIACAIAHQPEILIMDEPTVGIDPQSRNHILNSVKAMSRNGMTILYTTHYMEEVEAIASRILIMDRGEIIASGTNDELKEKVMAFKKIVIDLDEAEQVNTSELYNIEGISEVSLKENKLEITTISGIENLDKIIVTLLNQSVGINNLTCELGNLETVFLNLTGRHLRD